MFFIEFQDDLCRIIVTVAYPERSGIAISDQAGFAGRCRHAGAKRHVFIVFLFLLYAIYDQLGHSRDDACIITRKGEAHCGSCALPVDQCLARDLAAVIFCHDLPCAIAVCFHDIAVWEAARDLLHVDLHAGDLCFFFQIDAQRKAVRMFSSLPQRLFSAIGQQVSR